MRWPSGEVESNVTLEKVRYCYIRGRRRQRLLFICFYTCDRRDRSRCVYVSRTGAKVAGVRCPDPVCVCYCLPGFYCTDAGLKHERRESERKRENHRFRE